MAVFNLTPVLALTLVHAFVVLLLSAFALWVAVQLGREFREKAEGRKAESP